MNLELSLQNESAKRTSTVVRRTQPATKASAVYWLPTVAKSFRSDNLYDFPVSSRTPSVYQRYPDRERLCEACYSLAMDLAIALPTMIGTFVVLRSASALRHEIVLHFPTLIGHAIVHGNPDSRFVSWPRRHFRFADRNFLQHIGRRLL